MIRLEQVRSEVLERFERVDRRFAASDQRLARIDQRTQELSDRLEQLLETLSGAAPIETTPPHEDWSPARRVSPKAPEV